MFARRRFPGRSPALRRPRWYCTISVSSALWLEPTRCERRASSRSSAWFIACRRSVRLAKVLVFTTPTLVPHPDPPPKGEGNYGKGGGKNVSSSDFFRWVGLERRDGRRRGAEHGDPEMPGEAVEEPAHRLFAFRRGGENGVGKTGQVCPKSDRLGRIEAVPQSAAGDQRELRRRPVRQDERLRRGDPPLGEGERQLDFLGPLAPERLHPGEAGAAQPRDVDGGHPGLGQQRRGALRDAAADLLHDHRDG